MNGPSPTPDTIGCEVTWYPKSERWRIEIVGSATLQGVFMTHRNLVSITAVDTYDTAVIAGLVQLHRDTIEQCIATARAENWHDKHGLLPHSISHSQG